MFQFKRFVIHDDRCAMKVGTDGVLLGAWVKLLPAAHVLDVGAGSGLVSIMLAQRYPDAMVTAIELDGNAAEQAEENVGTSPFARQVGVVCADFLTCWQSSGADGQYDAIVSNPPFFDEDLLPDDAKRATARHTATGLTFERLVERSCNLLRSGGSFQVIVPKTSQNRFHGFCNAHGFTLVRTTDVRTVERKPPKRVLLHFVKDLQVSAPVLRDEIVLMQNGRRSSAYESLCGDFYL